MRTIRYRALAVIALIACSVFAASCGTTARQGRGSSYLIIDTFEAASGAAPDLWNGVLQSDVLTIVKSSSGALVPTIFEDFGRVTLRLAMKDVTSGTGPTTNNEITITGYHVTFIRADGRNGQGVDVPYAFDGAVTGTVSGTVSIPFVLVRAQAKKEAPLAALVSGGGAGIISAIAQVTFYGRDQAGNDVSVSGSISVNFADWGDPQ